MKKVIFLLITIISLSSCTQAIQEKQLEKARDTSRITDMKLLEAWIHQYFMDNNSYPAELSEITAYTYTLPTDPKNWETIDWKTYWYIYETAKNEEWVIDSFRISTYFESEKNNTKYTMDGGIYDDKFEIF